MPGTVNFSTPAAVFPGTLSRAFTETHAYEALVSEYHDGSSQRGALVSAPRHSWKLAKRLAPPEMAALREFIALHIADTFYFYNPKETSPVNTWDATGAATAGRYTVRVNSDWSESVGIARTDAAVELIEVGPAALIDSPGVDDDAYLRTGVWFANSMLGSVVKGQTENNEDAGLMLNPVDRGVYGVQRLQTGSCALARTAPFRDYDTYPHAMPHGLAPPPIADFNTAMLDCAIASAQYSHIPSTALASMAWITVWSDPEYQYGHLFDNWLAYSGATVYSQRVFRSEGHKDATENTIPSNLLDYVFNFTIWNTTLQGPVPITDRATLSAEDSVVALFFAAIRVNCGDARSGITHAEDLFHSYQYGNAFSGTYAWLPDQGYTDGEAYATGKAGDSSIPLYHYGRKGAEFTYTFGRNLFADAYDHCAYELGFGISETEGKAVGERVFSILVSSDGKTWTTVIADLDIRADYTGLAEARVDVTIDSWPNGKLYIKFVASVGEACCNYIRVTPKWL